MSANEKGRGGTTGSLAGRIQYAKHESVSFENGDVVDISINDGKVVISRGVHRERRAEEEIDPSAIVPQDD